jgi:hypothetical protein
MKLPPLTHKGLFCGIAPVYIGGLETDAPLVVERHWSLMPVLWMTEVLFSAFVFVGSLFAPDWEPMYPLVITGEIEPRA